MQEDDDETRNVAFDIDRISPALQILLDCDLDAEVDGDEHGAQRSLQDALTYLDEFQEEPYLLDVALDRIAKPALFRLRDALLVHRRLPRSRARLTRLVKWIYHLTKMRGYKAIVRLCPHEVTDLDVLLDIFQDSEDLQAESQYWELRYVLLLWLSLVCMLPFDLARWDRPNAAIATDQYLVQLGTRYLSSPGKERDAAALMLGKLLIRQDVSRSLLAAFLENATMTLLTYDHLAVGTLQTLCVAVEAGTRYILQPHLAFLYRLLAICDPTTTTFRNPLVRRYRVKLAGRLALVLMPQVRKPRRRRGVLVDAIAGFPLIAVSAARIALVPGVADRVSVTSREVAFPVPAEVEVIVQDLLEAIEDVDTSVRYSAAKHLARLVEALPASFADQVLEATFDSFGKGVVTAKDGARDLAAVSDGRWHGLCMATAECIRRNLVPPIKIAIILPWVFLAMHFDQRRGTRIVGSNVRDAAAYVIWSLARACEPAELTPFADDLARHLILTSLFDREIHIRRAASAAFQEIVGRLGIVAHGIELLPALDYYICGNRRTAFLTAAPAVARFDKYRPHIVDHLLSQSLVHYDAPMRELAAQSLHLVLKHDIASLGNTLSVLRSRISNRDLAGLHGSLLALAALTRLMDAATAEGLLLNLKDVPTTALAGFQSDITVHAACLATAALAVRLDPRDGSIPPALVVFLTAAGKKTSQECHEAAAQATGELSRVYDCSAEVKRSLTALKAFSPSVQACSALCLGHLDVAGRAGIHFETVLETLFAFVDVDTPKHASSVDARRNGLRSLVSLACARVSVADVSSPARTLSAVLLAGTDDYSTDQRGDVGSFIRMESMVGLATLLGSVDLASLWTVGDVDRIAATCVRQLIERIDGVREVALKQLDRVCGAASGAIALRDTVDRLSSVDHRDLNVALPFVLPLMPLGPYRRAILHGLASSFSSSASSHIVGAHMSGYLAGLTMVDDAAPDDQRRLLDDVVRMCKDASGDTRLFSPCIRLATFLLACAELQDLLARPTVSSTLQCLLSLVCDSVKAARTAPRAEVLAEAYIALFALDRARPAAVPHLPLFLVHRLPKVREHMATALYERVLLADHPEAEALVLENAWTGDGAAEAASELVRLLTI